MSPTNHDSSEQESRQVAEDAREREWAGRGFMREMFLGRFHFDWLDHLGQTDISPEAHEFLDRLESFLHNDVDSAEIDRSGQYPAEVLRRLREMGAFGMKISKAYGGLGFNVVEYARALELCAQYDANLVALLSAHQSIGVPEPLSAFGTEAQKRKYLPLCAKGAVSAFALTEENVGSDPASLSTVAKKAPEGDYVIDGEKLWCTNGTIAELFVVMARDPDTKRISAFVVEAKWPGVEVVHRCHFMGLRAIENGVIRFRNVRVPKENLVGKEGDGLRIALTTLNTGRLSLPAACVGLTKRCTEIVRRWSNERVQWGRPIGRHEAVAHKIADIAMTAYAVEAMTACAAELALQKGYDIRLEAAAAKEWVTVESWRVADTTMQIRGGRGYETEASLQARGEEPIGVERMMRDCRINLIFEGSSEIMHLFMAREGVDKHLEVAGALIDPKRSIGEKLKALPKMILFYAAWYPMLWFGALFAAFRYRGDGVFGAELRYCDRAARRLARSMFHGMLVFRAALERRQAFLFRTVDVANLIFAMAASIARARRLIANRDPRATTATELAQAFCASARRRIDASFHTFSHNDDAAKTAFSRQVLDGRYEWLEAVRTDAAEEPTTPLPPRRPALTPEGADRHPPA